MRSTSLFSILWITVFSIIVFSNEANAQASKGFERMDIPESFGLWVTALPSGELMSWWPEEKPGAADATGTTQLALARFSKDNGNTWSEPHTLFEFPRVEGEARYIAGADGVILVDNEGGIHIFGSLRNKTFSWETYEGELVVYHVMSKDNGKTWSDVTFVPTPYKYCGIQQPLVMKSGRIVLPIWHTFDTKREWGAFCVVSDDRGKTWKTGDQIIAKSKVRAQLDEQSGVELNDGRIWMLFRAHNGKVLTEAYSSDGGLT